MTDQCSHTLNAVFHLMELLDSGKLVLQSQLEIGVGVAVWGKSKLV